MPAASRRNPSDDATSHHGTMPSLDGSPLADVEVVEEAVEHRDPLDEPGLDVVPLVGRDQPGEQVHRERALDALALAVDGERDARGPERLVADRFAPGELARGEGVELADETGVVVAWTPVALVGLVEEPLDLVPLEQPRHLSGPYSAYAGRGGTARSAGVRADLHPGPPTDAAAWRAW